MKHLLENEYLSVRVKEEGAELISLRHKQLKLEYLWQADPAVWARHAPLLFPVVGKLKDDQYLYEGKTYTMGQHGFARDLPWKVEASNADQLVFLLTEGPESLQKYPFPFELRTVYSLEEATLIINHQVKNTGAGAMPFSIGAHPGFCCPLKAGEQFEDYFLEFEKPESLHRQLLTNGLRNGQTEPVTLQNERHLPLSTELFKRDAIVLEGLNSDWLSLRTHQDTHGLSLQIKGFPYLGIWTKPGNRSFICLEPWFGVADKLGGEEEAGPQDIRRKEGIIMLPAGETFSCQYKIALF